MFYTLTRHNGRYGKNGVYNPRHNDRSFNVENSDHIDADRAKRNVYWDCMHGLHGPGSDPGYASFEDVEKDVYQLFYHKATEAQNERNIKTGIRNGTALQKICFMTRGPVPRRPSTRSAAWMRLFRRKCWQRSQSFSSTS